MVSCLVCCDTGLLLQDACPLCTDETLDGGCASSDPGCKLEGNTADDVASSLVSQRSAFWCDICNIDLQSRNALTEHVKGRKHLHRKGAMPVARLKHLPKEPITEEQLFAKLIAGEFREILVLTGAGVSTAAGIPDFRSAGGLFEMIRRTWASRFPEVLDAPENLLSRHFARAHPKVWEFEVQPWLRSMKWASAAPTSTHWFCSWLHRQGFLRRVYTQNVDGLHLRPELELPRDLVVECHGALRDGSIVLYGDSLPSRFDDCCKVDLPNLTKNAKVDLVLVFGTSLQVAPFCALPNMVPRGCTRVIVNRRLSDCMTNPWCRMKQSSMYSSSDLDGCSFASVTARIGDWKSATLRPLWREKKGSQRWQQLLVESDCDAFVDRFFAHLERTTA